MNRASKPVVIITGVSSGIGLAAAALFARKGWIVVGTVRSRNKSAELRALSVDIQVADMLRPADLERVIVTARRTYGRIDVLVCNAGYGLIGAVETLTYTDMQEQLAVNILAPAELIRHVVPVMKQEGSGVIIGMSSIVGRVGLSGYSLYASSKFGLEGLFESLSMELAPWNVRVKLVEPSGVRTAFWTSLQGDTAVPAGAGLRLGGATSSLSAEDVAAVIFRAATDTSTKLRYPLGQTRWVDYGRRILPERVLLRALRRFTHT